MAANTYLFLLFVAFAILGPVHGVHREELPATTHLVAWQHPQRALVKIAETKGNASSQTLRQTGRGAGFAHVNRPRYSESAADSQDAAAAQHNETIADIHASSHGLNISRPNGESDALQEGKDEVNTGATVHGFNVSGVRGWDGAASENEVNEEIQDPTHKASMPSPDANAETIGEPETKDKIREEIRELNVSGVRGWDAASENEVDEEIQDPTHKASMPSLDANAETIGEPETKDKIREEIRELNVSDVIKRDGEPGDSGVRAEPQDQTHTPNLSSLKSEVGRRYAGYAMDVVTHAVKAAREQDQEAARGMDQASATFRKAEDAQAKADAASKGALDAEAQLIDAKAAALRDITAAQEGMVAAAKANMDAIVDSSYSPLVLQREERTAEEAVLRAKRGFNAVRGKLSGAERASVAAQQTAAQAAHKTVAAHHELEMAKDSAATAVAKRAWVEEEAAQALDGIVRSSETFDGASKAKEEALQSLKVAKQELVDAAHNAVVMTQKAGNGTSQMPSSSSPV